MVLHLREVFLSLRVLFLSSGVPGSASALNSWLDNFKKRVPYEDRKDGLGAWWSYVVAWVLGRGGVDGVSQLGWEAAGGDSTLAPAHAPAQQQIAPQRVTRNRKFAPYPIAVAADGDYTRFDNIYEQQGGMGDAHNGDYALNTVAYPAIEYGPLFVYQDSVAEGQGGVNWEVAVSERFAETAYQPEITSHMLEQLRSRNLLFDEKAVKTPDDWNKEVRMFMTPEDWNKEVRMFV